MITAFPEEWDKERGIFLDNRHDRRRIDELNTRILNHKGHVQGIVDEYENTRVPWSINMLKERSESKPKTIFISRYSRETSCKRQEGFYPNSTKESKKRINEILWKQI